MTDKREKVFLIGAGRSGTKFLRSCLSASDEVDSVPYDISYVWRYGNENIEHDEFLPENLDQKTRKWIVETLPDMTDTHKANARFIVEKSVPNTLRVSFINALFPNAKFIHLTRDGRAVIESSIRQWKSPADKNYLLNKLRYFPWKNYRYAFWYFWNLIKSKATGLPSIWGPRYRGIEKDIKNLSIEEVCAKQWSRCVDIADEQLNQIDDNRVYRVSFEELMSDSKVLLDLCEFIGMKDSSTVLEYFEKNVNRSNNQKSIDSLNTKSKVAIDKYAAESLRRLGYK